MGGDNTEFEELSQDIFYNFGLCEQILNDFVNGQLLTSSNWSSEQTAARTKLVSNLMIDSIIRRAEYAKFYQDLDSSIQDFTMVIKICKEYPEGNERVLGSAYYNLGKIYLEQNKRDEAMEKFKDVLNVLKGCLFEKLKKNGQTEIDSNIDLTDLVKPSIFDDEKIQELKSSLIDVHEDILECQQLDEIQPKLDQMKKEAQENADNGVDTSVPEGFGMP